MEKVGCAAIFGGIFWFPLLFAEIGEGPEDLMIMPGLQHNLIVNEQ